MQKLSLISEIIIFTSLFSFIVYDFLHTKRGTLDLLTPNRLIHGRAMVRLCTIKNPARTFEKMEDDFQEWSTTWYNKKLADIVAKPPKWYQSGPAIQVGDSRVQKRPQEQKLGTPIWSVGHIIETVPATIDSLIHEVVVDYKNASKKVFRMTRRAARSVATLFKEEDLDLIQKLIAVSREATKALLMRGALAPPARPTAGLNTP
jgi:hypothetical protein